MGTLVPTFQNNSIHQIYSLLPMMISASNTAVFLKGYFAVFQHALKSLEITGTVLS